MERMVWLDGGRARMFLARGPYRPRYRIFFGYRPGSMLDRAFLSSYRVLPARPWEAGVTGVFRAMGRLTRTRVERTGFAWPASPVIFASNSTQKYDFMLLRAESARLGLPVVTVTKAKNYHSPARTILENTGVVPIGSKGYVLLLDFRSVHGRRPDEGEYRAMRRHLDEGDPLPETAPFRALQGQPREILGHRFAPTDTTWREAIRQVYAAMMAETVRLSREAVRAGYNIHMYPEGTVSSRLGVGRVGVMQLARALGVPVVPVGMSGCREVFRGQSAALRGGTMEMRFGEPYLPDFTALSGDFRPFHPDDERAHRAALQAATDDLMERINGLLWPSVRRAEGFVPDGTQGTRRFL